MLKNGNKIECVAEKWDEECHKWHQTEVAKLKRDNGVPAATDSLVVLPHDLPSTMSYQPTVQPMDLNRLWMTYCSA